KEDTRAVKSGNYEYMNGYYYIHTGSFTNYDLAHKQMVRLKEYGSSHIVPVEVGGKKYYRVSVGPFTRKEEATVAQAKLKYYGFKDTKVEKK
ncbi:MAG: SPOR domain-containing protein, partial [Alphaproteobacteria bacterium]|nr:SPOR domain-containing protein [Alphaproteobacteria bacterium]